MGQAAGNFLLPREADIQSAVLDHWRMFQTVGSLVAAVPNARAHGQAGLTRGLFDLVVLSPALHGATAWLELKRGKGGRLSDAQTEFRSLLLLNDVPHAVATGRDEPIEWLKRWGAIR